MKPKTFLVSGALMAANLILLPAGIASAAPTPTTVGFSGTITSTMAVNNGTNTGTIAAGTAYTGSFTFDSSQNPTPVAFGGGAHTVYAFSNLAISIGSSTANSGPGTIDVFDNLTTTVGYPSGDSVYVNFTQGVPNTMGVAPNGLLAGASFNWMGLAFLDSTGHAVTGGKLPASFGSAAFPTTFSEFNFGTAGTPFGAGNTSMIQSLTSTRTPPPPALTFTPTLPAGTVGVPYSSTFGSASGGTAPYGYTATGLPAGLSLSGNTVSGTPTAGGIFAVTLTATDAVGAVASAQVSLSIGAHGHYSVPDEGQGTITALGPKDAYVKVGTTKLIWNSKTEITVNTPGGPLHVVGSFVQPGMSITWEGLMNKAGNTVQASQLVIN